MSKIEGRQCGECTACCTVFEINDRKLKKEADVPCQHLCENGCGIYPTRPKTCKRFHCLWRLGHGTLEDQPNRNGVVMTWRNLFEFKGPKNVAAVGMNELQTGALKEQRVIDETRQWREKGYWVRQSPVGRTFHTRFFAPLWDSNISEAPSEVRRRFLRAWKSRAKVEVFLAHQLGFEEIDGAWVFPRAAEAAELLRRRQTTSK